MAATVVGPPLGFSHPSVVSYTWVAFWDDQVRVTGWPEDWYAAGSGERVTEQAGGEAAVQVMATSPAPPDPVVADPL